MKLITRHPRQIRDACACFSPKKGFDLFAAVDLGKGEQHSGRVPGRQPAPRRADPGAGGWHRYRRSAGNLPVP